MKDLSCGLSLRSSLVNAITCQSLAWGHAIPLQSNFRMTHLAASCAAPKIIHDYFFEIVVPEYFNRGSSQNFAWIPAKSMRE